MSGRKVLFLDFHGTLGTHPLGWSGTIAGVLNERYSWLAVTPDQVRPCLGTGFPWHAPEVSHPQLDTADKWWQALAPLLEGTLAALGAPAGDHGELLGAIRRQYLDIDKWLLYDDVLPTLGYLAEQGWQQVIVSNHVPELADIVGQLGLAPYLVGVVSSGLAGYEKPHPGLFAAAFRLIGGHAPDDVVWMVGDSWSADVVGAQGVGLPAVLVRTSHPSAPFALAGLGGLPDFLDTRLRDQSDTDLCYLGDA